MLEFVDGDPLIPPEPTSGYARPRGDAGLTLLVLVFCSSESGHRIVRGRRGVVVARRNDKAWPLHLPLATTVQYAPARRFFLCLCRFLPLMGLSWSATSEDEEAPIKRSSAFQAFGLPEFSDEVGYRRWAVKMHSQCRSEGQQQ